MVEHDDSRKEKILGFERVAENLQETRPVSALLATKKADEWRRLGETLQENN